MSNVDPIARIGDCSTCGPGVAIVSGGVKYWRCKTAWRMNQKGAIHRLLVGNRCEKCGFEGHECQLDVDHIDGDFQNNDPSNLRTLCANCHRLETYLKRQMVARRYRGLDGGRRRPRTT